MFSGLFITLSLCHSWGHILELFSFTFQKILEGKDKCCSASLELVVPEKHKYSSGSLCFYLPLQKEQALKGGCSSTRARLSSGAPPVISCSNLKGSGRVPPNSHIDANSSPCFP